MAMVLHTHTRADYRARSHQLAPHPTGVQLQCHLFLEMGHLDKAVDAFRELISALPFSVDVCLSSVQQFIDQGWYVTSFKRVMVPRAVSV